MSDTEKATPDYGQTRTMTDDEATNMRLEQWLLLEMELLQGLVDEGKLSGPSVGMAARGLWNMAHKAGRLAALEEAEKVVRPTYQFDWLKGPDGYIVTDDPIQRANASLHHAADRIAALRSSSPEGSN